MPTIGRDERTWLTHNFSADLMQHFDLEQHERRMRLWCAGCCRHWWARLSDTSRQYITVVERYADGLATLNELLNARREVGALATYDAEVERQDAEFYTRCVGVELGWHDEVPASEALARLEEAQHRREAARFVSDVVRQDITGTTYRWIDCGADEERASQLLRDIFGNPFRTIIFSPEWRTDTAVALAHTVYDAREFGAMPILADALQDAGCNEPAILDHCRDTTQPHVRGCWVVDLVLGKN